MKFKTLTGILILLIACSCLKKVSKNKQSVEKNFNLKSGLYIENGINRGLAFTDSLGDKYAITYISVTVTNNSTIPIHFRTNFEMEYDHPLVESNERFKIVILPKEWTNDGTEITDSMINKIPHYSNIRIHETKLNPKDKYIFAIGTLRPSPAKICGIIPNAFFAKEINEIYSECNRQIQKQNLSESQIELGVRLNYCHINGKTTNCSVISCGEISYSEF